ncbi:DUF1232 domain-containing protein [Candidatus Uhrbacteria bacterium]|nr:MAG: DUF1232 domain-containing protein [Candidatus Uhrbacteria bacterium]
MRKTSFIPNLRAIWLFVKDPSTDWKPKALVVAAVLYLVWPIDLLPDFAPIVGWLDDLGFIGAAAWYLAHATNRYLERKK